jgi:ketosteroid isomerase-like protein
MVSRAPRRTLSDMSARTPEEVHALLEAALNARDPDAFAAVFEPDAVMIAPPHGEVIRGRTAIRASVEPMMGTTGEIEVVGKLEANGLALTHARWRLGEMSGYGTIVSRRQPDGSWLIVLDNPLSFARDDPHDRHLLT